MKRGPYSDFIISSSATATNITTTYAGEFAGEYIAAALLSASTIDDGGLTVKPNIAYKEVIKRLDTGAVVSDASCDFNPNSSVTASTTFNFLLILSTK